MKFLARNIMFDEIPCPLAPVDTFDWHAAEERFSIVGKELSQSRAKGLGIIATYIGENRLSNGGVLLFGKTKTELFPDAIIRCVCFSGVTREKSLDHTEISTNLPAAVDEVLHFISKNIKVKSHIEGARRIDTPQYPLDALREAVTNAVVHADYAIIGSSIIVAIFEDRIEITNPGALPHGFSMEEALAGSSRSRNRVIAKTFHALELVEQWGSGLKKIIDLCIQHGLRAPEFKEFGSQFRVTIYAPEATKRIAEQWQKDFIEHLQTVGSLSTNDAASFWKVDIRHARRRLKELMDEGIITKVGTSKNDPLSKYVVVKK